MATIYVVFERGTDRVLGRGTFNDVREAMAQARAAGIAADMRREMRRDRHSMYRATRSAMRTAQHGNSKHND